MSGTAGGSRCPAAQCAVLWVSLSLCKAALASPALPRSTHHPSAPPRIPLTQRQPPGGVSSFLSVWLDAGLRFLPPGPLDRPAASPQMTARPWRGGRPPSAPPHPHALTPTPLLQRSLCLPLPADLCPSAGPPLSAVVPLHLSLSLTLSLFLLVSLSLSHCRISVTCSRVRV